VTLRRTV